MIKVNPSLKQPSQEVHRKIPFRTVVQRFTVNLQPSFTKKGAIRSMPNPDEVEKIVKSK